MMKKYLYKIWLYAKFPIEWHWSRFCWTLYQRFRGELDIWPISVDFISYFFSWKLGKKLNKFERWWQNTTLQNYSTYNFQRYGTKHDLISCYISVVEIWEFDLFPEVGISSFLSWKLEITNEPREIPADEILL